MSENLIFKWKDLSDHKQVQQEIASIFFETSTKKDFASVDEKNQFFYKYVGYYLEHYPDYVWVAKSDQILGYLVAATESYNREILEIQPHLEKFKDCFNKYPAHLHINLSSASQGLGLGSKLVSELEKSLQLAKISGLHIMTGPDSPNKYFYQKLGFSFELERNSILFMGKRPL